MDGSCDGVDLLGSYWTTRRTLLVRAGGLGFVVVTNTILKIPILTFSTVSLLLSACLSYKLFKVQ